jgi:G3E family GTPase
MRVIVVVGFLGSGKTTTILELARRIAACGERIAFLINDAGTVEIDGTVIRGGGHQMVEIFNGCLCLMRDDLYAGLSELVQVRDLDWVIIEPSGMADAERMNKLLERFPRTLPAALAGAYSVHHRLTLLDASRYQLLMRSVRTLIRGGIKIADTILLNKCDLVTASQADGVEEHIRRIAGRNVSVERISADQGLPDRIGERIAGI